MPAPPCTMMVMRYEYRVLALHSCRYCYSCPDIVKEFKKYEKEPAKWIKQ